MADLSQVIQQGTERSGDLGRTLSAQAGVTQNIASSQSTSMMQQKAMQMQVQGRVDQMANSYSAVARQLIQKKNAAKSAQQKAIDAGDNKSADRARAELEIATGNLSNYIYDLSSDPRAMANLQHSALGAKNITEDFFNVENMEGATEEERGVMAQRLATLGAMAQQAGGKSLQRIQDESYARARGADLAAGADVPDDPTPVGSIISSAALVTKLGAMKKGPNVGEDKAKLWHVNYFDPLNRDKKAINGMPNEEKDYFGEAFSRWVGQDQTRDDAKAFKAQFLEEGRPDDLSEAGTTLYDLLEGVLQQGDPRLLGEFINQTKGLLRAPTAKQLKSRTTGAEAGGV